MAEMTEVAKGVATHQRLVALLTQENARYRVVSHEAVGKCEAVSEIRGTALGQGAKALVCKVKGNGVNQHVLAILAADQQADLSQLASHLGGLRASLASPAEVDMLTGCVFGAIPPFSFHPNLKLVADPLLRERFFCPKRCLPAIKRCILNTSFNHHIREMSYVPLTHPGKLES